MDRDHSGATEQRWTVSDGCGFGSRPFSLFGKIKYGSKASPLNTQYFEF